MGAASVGTNRDRLLEGPAEAFQYTASVSGVANRLYIYIDSASAAKKVIVGLYTNTGSNIPGNLITQITIASPVKGAWNTAVLPGANITAGTKYWIAILAPTGSGAVKFRDVLSGSPSQTSAQTNLTSLPATWTPGTNYATSPMSAYIVQN
jgi:hypothetical protein